MNSLSRSRLSSILCLLFAAKLLTNLARYGQANRCERIGGEALAMFYATNEHMQKLFFDTCFLLNWTQ